MALASSLNRALCSAFSRLMATILSRCVSRAFQPSAWPPEPAGAISTYGPNCIWSPKRPWLYRLLGQVHHFRQSRPAGAGAEGLEATPRGREGVTVFNHLCEPI